MEVTAAPDRAVVEELALLAAVAARARRALQAMARRNRVGQEVRARHSPSQGFPCITEVAVVVGSMVIRVPCPLERPVPVA